MDSRVASVMSNLRKPAEGKKGLEGYYSNRDCDLIAKCVDYCFSESKLASFRNPVAIAKVIDRNRVQDDVIGSYGKVVISIDREYQGALRIRHNTNCSDPSKIRMSEIIVKQNGKSIGFSKVFKIEDSSNSIEGFIEKDLSQTIIEDLDDINKDMNDEERKLYEKMKICSDLFTPVLKYLDPVKGVVEPVSEELKAMIREGEEANKTVLNERASNK